MLSRYYKHDYWIETPELQDYDNADMRLDPNHDDLPEEHHLKVEDRVIQ